MDVKRAKTRLYLRLEKFFITLESLLIATFVGMCVGLYFGRCAHDWRVGAVFGFVFFVGIYTWKRFIIKKELK